MAFFARRVSETEVEEQKLDCVVSACQRWYDQLVAYLEGLDGELQPNQARFSEWCDFSQLVWSETKEVGFGVAHDPEVGVVVVAKYSPQGNSADQYDLKVMHPERPWKEIKEEERKMVEERTARRRARAKEDARDEQFNDYQLDALSRHNAFRQRHCDTGNLELSLRLCQEAQQEAKYQIESMYSSSDYDQADRVRGYNGTNYRVCAIPVIDEGEDNPEERLKILTGETIIEWYSQLRNYLKSLDAKKQPDQVKFDSWCCFTQLVWRQSYEMGFAIEFDLENRAHIVAKYRSQGNVINCYLENVGLPRVPQRNHSAVNAE